MAIRSVVRPIYGGINIIIIKYMELGSLYDVLHNELVPKLPDTLKNKLALQVLLFLFYLFT